MADLELTVTCSATELPGNKFRRLCNRQRGFLIGRLGKRGQAKRAGRHFAGQCRLLAGCTAFFAKEWRRRAKFGPEWPKRLANPWTKQIIEVLRWHPFPPCLR